VSNICKITRTMEMIATARFKKSYNSAVGTRPYTEKIAELVSSLAAGGEMDHPLLRNNENRDSNIVLVLTSNRGLCGGYNCNVIRLADEKIQELGKPGKNLDLRVAGKKGIQYFKFSGHEIGTGYTQFDDKTTYADVEVLADEFIELYSTGEIEAVHVVYTRFESAGKFYPEQLTLLPLSSPMTEKEEGTEARITMADYIFSPGAEKILQELIPTTVRTRLFQCFTDALVSEQVARMRAMKAATDNATQMIQDLSRQYNRARQNQITGELLDILGGVEALK